MATATDSSTPACDDASGTDTGEDDAELVEVGSHRKRRQWLPPRRSPMCQGRRRRGCDHGCLHDAIGLVVSSCLLVWLLGWMVQRGGSDGHL
jgi:hypothetical protein